MADQLFLYWADGSPSCWRVTIALEEKNLSTYRHKHLDFSKNEHKSEEVLRLNPRGQVPTFTHGDIVINESLAAIQYLEDTFEDCGNRLMPTKQKNKAKVLQRMVEALNLHRRTEDTVYYALMTDLEDFCQGRLSSLKQATLKEVQLWESYLQQMNSNESYIAGEQFSLADAALFPYLAFLVHHGLQIEQNYPNLASYYKLVCKRPSVQATWPSYWKDPNKQMIVPTTLFSVEKDGSE